MASSSAEFWRLCWQYASRRVWEKADSTASGIWAVVFLGIFEGLPRLAGYEVTFANHGIEAVVFFLTALGVVFGWRLLFTAPQAIWADAQSQVSQLTRCAQNLEQQLTPRLKLSFSNTDPGCVRPESKIMFNFGTARTVIDVTYYRLKAESDGVATVNGCSGRLTHIYRNDELVMAGENLILTFAPAEKSDSTNKTIHHKIPEYLDFLAIAKQNMVLMPTHEWKGPSSVDLAKIFSSPATFRFHIAVLIPGMPTVEIEPVLKWTGDHITAEVYV